MKATANRARELRKIILNALDDLKAQNVLALDVSAHSSVTDTMIIASGNSNRQVRALVDHAIEEAKNGGHTHLSVDENRKNDWVIADFGDVVLHVFIPEAREYYDLERLWQIDGNVITEIDEAVAKPAKKRASKKVEIEETFSANALETQTDRARASKPAARRSSSASVDAKLKKAPLKAGTLAKAGIKKTEALKASKEAQAAAKKAAPKKAGSTAKTAAKSAVKSTGTAAKTKIKATKATSAQTTSAKPAASKPRAASKSAKPEANAAKSAGARAARASAKAKE